MAGFNIAIDNILTMRYANFDNRLIFSFNLVYVTIVMSGFSFTTRSIKEMKKEFQFNLLK